MRDVVYLLASTYVRAACWAYEQGWDRRDWEALLLRGQRLDRLYGLDSPVVVDLYDGYEQCGTAGESAELQEIYTRLRRMRATVISSEDPLMNVRINRALHERREAWQCFRSELIFSVQDNRPLLERIESEVEDWESGPDAMRWSPEVAEEDTMASGTHVEGGSAEITFFPNGIPEEYVYQGYLADGVFYET